MRLSQSDASIPQAEILVALEEMMGSSDFPASPRNRRFLQYVVRHTLERRFEKISGYHVATEVFGRAADFNPTTDPIVRIEASKLRRDIETYYLKGGAGAAVRIALPRGGYIPLFRRCTPAVEVPALATDAVTVHALHGGHCALAQAEPYFRARVVDRLAREPGLAVFAGPATAPADGLLDSDTARDLAQRNGTRFIFSGAAHPGDDGGLSFVLRLHDGKNGQMLWSEEVTGPPAALEDAVVARASAMVREWARKVAGNSSAATFPEQR